MVSVYMSTETIAARAILHCCARKCSQSGSCRCFQCCGLKISCKDKLERPDDNLGEDKFDLVQFRLSGTALFELFYSSFSIIRSPFKNFDKFKLNGATDLKPFSSLLFGVRYYRFRTNCFELTKVCHQPLKWQNTINLPFTYFVILFLSSCQLYKSIITAQHVVERFEKRQ